ncbi:hypothetical protein [Streptomyces cinerochromogenes]|uniref:hypothetical protein n=1 Tax=Streptomyces cinerochromogenes TaxID=66422 RepID=UPI0033A8F302
MRKRCSASTVARHRAPRLLLGRRDAQLAGGADTTAAKVANTVAVLEEAGRPYWAPGRYGAHQRGGLA